MMENKSRLSRPLVVGRQSNGRCRYDPEAKQELVEACFQPGVSVARMALEYGINANLLRKWINQYREAVGSVTLSTPAPLSAFAPVLSVDTPKPVETRLTVALPTGVKLEWQGGGLPDLSPFLNELAALPCSASNRG